MASKVLEVTGVTRLNAAVARVQLERDVSVDVPDVCGFCVEAGERVSLEVDPSSSSQHACEMRGVVYEVHGGTCSVSCGGLLVSIPGGAFRCGDVVRIGLSKSRRRKLRSTSSS